MRRTLARLSARIAPDAPSAAGGSTPSFARPDTPATRPPRAQYGQALPHSHPHLFPRTLPFPAPPPLSLSLSGASAPAQADVAHEQLTPGIPAAEYAERRSRLMQSLPEGSAVLVMAARIKCMSGNINYRFRQDSNFWYLTGWQEPDAALLLESAPSSAKGYKMTMFVSPRDSVSELWNGPRNGIDGAMDVFGADQAFAMDPVALQAYLKTLLSSTSHFYLDLPSSPSFPRRSRSSSSSSTSSGNLLTYLTPSASSLDVFSKKSDFDALVKLLNDSKRTRALAPFVEKLRLVKSRHELGVMRKAGAIGSKGMREVMRFAEVGRSEGQVQATFEHLTSLHGAQRPAYVPVVASGLNALTIHYIANESLLHANDLVCIDAGPEVDGYVSDITRVFPVSSRFSSAQKDLYSAVLRVLKQCTSLATAQNGYTQGELHRRSVELLRVELERLGFNLRSGMLERLYPHSLSHWLGIDLHDTPTVERGTRLQEGHVLTIEPAVYVPQGDDAFPKAFWGMGIRIEDDVAVGYDSNVVLSAEAPREVEDVEAACAGWEEGVESVRREVSEQMRRTQ